MEQRYFDDIELGYSEESDELVVGRAEMIEYAKRNDPFPIHTDEVAAADSPFGDVIASFGYVVSLFFRLAHTQEFNRTAGEAFLGALEWRVQFRGPVRGGDRLRLRSTVVSKRVASKGDRGVITSTNEMLNQNDDPMVVIDITSLILRRPDGGGI